jgi:glycosidase
MGRTFWDEARDALDRAHPGAFLLAESTSPELMLHAFDATYGVSHMWTLFKTLEFGAPASQLRANWESDRAKFPRGTLFLRAVDNHDQRRAVTEFGNRAALAAMVVNFTLDGIPFIYNGQEIGDPNPTPVHFAYPIWWKQERTATLRVEGFTLYRGGYIGQDLDIYKKLIALRRREVALRRGDVQWVGNSDEDRIVSYMRVAGDQQFLIIVNMTNRPWKGTVAPGAGLSGFRAAITDLAEPTLVSNGRTFSLGPYGYFVGQREPAKG